jgi:hypothetical protein
MREWADIDYARRVIVVPRGVDAQALQTREEN